MTVALTGRAPAGWGAEMTRPATAGFTTRVRAALDVIARTQNRCVQAGTDSSLSVLTLGLAPPESLIAAAERPADLAYIRVERDELRIGSLTARAAALRSPLISQYCDVLGAAVRADAAQAPGAPATIGAALCRPGSADGLRAALTRLQASAVIRSPQGERIVPVGELSWPGKQSVRPGELLAEVRIPIAGVTAAG
jgi:aerobic carbon-monoxide dehydrogenase medium subunit